LLGAYAPLVRNGRSRSRVSSVADAESELNVLVFMVDISDSLVTNENGSCDEITILTLHCARNHAKWLTRRISRGGKLQQRLTI